ncbi:hypothetical protein SO802_012266 [Lithocarpus litseifolius]|uniref:F-box domain-containing protein n=1 Tax=Lithocarpus litseifolius TaxID=425828 RepID=A0AAW2D6C7_9ROSI
MEGTLGVTALGVTTSPTSLGRRPHMWFISLWGDHMCTITCTCAGDGTHVVAPEAYKPHVGAPPKRCGTRGDGTHVVAPEAYKPHVGAPPKRCRTREENKLGCQLSELPENLIYEIGKRLTIYADYVRLRSTCKSFQSLLPKLPNHQLSQVPLLMIPPANDASETHCKFFSMLENKMYKLELPKVLGKLLRGSSYGWVLMMDGHAELNLINPLTRAQIQLPPIDTFPDVLGYRPYMADQEYLILRVRPNLPKPAKVQVESIAYVRDVFIHKLVLSSNPTTSKEYMAMAIYSMVSDLAFCKNGDKKWTLIQENDQHINHDIISYKGKFYVLRNDGGLWVGDRNSLPNMTQLVPSLPRTIYSQLFFFGEDDIR